MFARLESERLKVKTPLAASQSIFDWLVNISRGVWAGDLQHNFTSEETKRFQLNHFSGWAVNRTKVHEVNFLNEKDKWVRSGHRHSKGLVYDYQYAVRHVIFGHKSAILLRD